MTIERIKELLEIAEGVNYRNTYYTIITYDKSKFKVWMYASGKYYMFSVDELAEDYDIAFYNYVEIGQKG